MVVVAIIGMLSSVVLVSLNTARTKARNTLRISQIEQIRTAFNIALTSSPYPNPAYAYPCLTTTCYEGWATYTGESTIDAYLAPYIKKSPDPNGGTRGYGGFLLLTPANWTGSPPAFPQGYYIDYLLESIATDCGPGTIYDRQPNYLQCLMAL